MPEVASLNKSLNNYKLIRTLQEKIGSFRGEPVHHLFRRYQKIHTPVLPADVLQYQDYSDEWASMYRSERDCIMKALKVTAVLDIEHIGSTSIKGLASNNIIDIALIVESEYLGSATVLLAEAGFKCFGNSPVCKTANWYWKVLHGSKSAFVIHVDDQNSQWLSDTVNFRDYLSIYDHARENYSAMKRKIAKLKQEDMLTYSLLKLELTDEIQKKASAWRTNGTN